MGYKTDLELINKLIKYDNILLLVKIRTQSLCYNSRIQNALFACCVALHHT